MNQVTNQPMLQARIRDSFPSLLPKFETWEQASYRKKNIARQLSEHGEEVELELARKLEDCGRYAPCNSPVCPVCLRDERREFIEQALLLVGSVCSRVSLAKGNIIEFSIKLPEERHVVGKLHRANLRNMNKRLQRRFERGRLPIVLAGIRFVLQEDINGLQDVWQLQVRGVVVGLPGANVTKALTENFSCFTDRPVQVEFQLLHHALSNIIRPTFYRLVASVEDYSSIGKRVRLKSPQLRELAIWLDQYPMSARYILAGCRRYSDRFVATSWPKAGTASDVPADVVAEIVC